jgi:hypothetical protein
MTMVRLLIDAAFFGALAAMVVSLGHWCCVITDLMRDDAPWWVMFVGPLNFVIPGALTEWGRSHFFKTCLWLLAAGLLIMPAVLTSWTGV